jgi:hypothetical protein
MRIFEKSFSYCNYSKKAAKRKAHFGCGFLLLECMVCVLVLVTMSWVVMSAHVSAARYYARARELHLACERAGESHE